MANFCGKCGSRLDAATGLCPNCDKPKKQPKFCYVCGSILDDATGICPICSKKSQVPPTNRVQPKANKKANGKTIAINIILAICLFITLFDAVSIYEVRNSLSSKDNAEALLENVNVYQFVDDKYKDKLEVHMQKKYDMDVSDEQIENIVNDSDFTEFFAEKIYDFGKCFLKGKGKVEITKNELYRLLYSNDELINDELNTDFYDEDFYDMANWFINDKENEKEKVTVIDMKDLESVPISVLRFILSYATMTVFIIISIIIVVLMIKNNLSMAMTGTGIDFVIIGMPLSILTGIITIGFSLWELLVNSSPYGIIVGNVIKINAFLNIALLLAGIVLMLIPHFIQKHKEKKSASAM